MLLKTTLLRKFIIAFTLLFSVYGISQPITLNQSMTPAQYVQNVLVGSGVTVSNIKYNGSAAAANIVQNTVASFTNTVAGFPMASGVVMTTGNANIAPGPNDFSDESTGTGTVITDADLDALTGSSVQNGSVIEFDFVTTSTNFEFQYIFGSEEYLDFVGSSFNDVFGFFLSGPGISGPFTGGAVNLAVVPGTSTPISINTVNPSTNSAYYFDNPIGNGTVYGSSIEYNGTTVLMTVKYNIVCNQTYHMKFAICNVVDKSWDSGVFVKAGSFTAMPDLIAAGPNQTVCGSAGTVVNLTGDAGTLNAHWSGGTGTFANANTATTTYTLSAADIAAGSVTLTLTGTNPCTGNVVSSTMTISFANPTVTVTPPNATICPGSGASVNLTGTTTANTAVRLPRPFTNSTATTIPNNATGISSVINVTGITPNNASTNPVVSVKVNITHPKSSELTVQLVSPGGTTITLKSGLSGLSNSVTGANMTNTVFSMSAATPIASATPPYTGSFVPVGNMNGLTGVINGNWTLKVIDAGTGFWDNTTNGSLTNWTINFTTDNYIQTYTWSPTTNMTNSTTLTPTVTPTTTTTYTLTATDAAGCTRSASTTITVSPAVTPTFAAVGPYCSGATIPALPTTSTNGVTGTWSPAINNTATTTYTFTPSTGQCATTTTLTINITASTTPSFAAVGPYCSGATIPALPTTSTNGINGTWSPAINNTTTTTYTFTPAAGQCATTTTLTINITAQTTPNFAAVGPYCSGATIPALPTTSTNGINGTWSPAINNTATTTYTFTPAAGQCATTTTLTINITAQTTPNFAAVGPYCSGATIPALPTTSTNGINGTWSPAINNTATTTYTFTPAAGQCATTTTLTINITAQTTPNFAVVGPYCSGATIPALPTTSTNGINGTWSPAINNTATTTYTFTPAAGQCATTTTLTINITAQTTPNFAAVGPYCSGATIPALPTTSTNGINGTWSPAINNTATTTYTFTPTAGQCATTTTTSITITAQTTPTFNIIPQQCVGDVPPSLQTTSNNGISGTWSPSTINTATNGTTTYTFTPNAGQCATTATISVVVGPPTTPTFTAIAAFCENTTAPVLPTTSSNGFAGTWSPGVVDNAASGSYTFTPNSGQCATTATMSITVNPRTNPTFTAYPAYCTGSAIPALPTTSTNGISGTWSPAIDNTTTTTYTFTPNASECANPATMQIVINAATTPTFNALTAVCKNGTAPALPTSSTNGVTGTWSPASFTTTTAGTFTSTFTPDAGQCATTATISLVVNDLPTITVNSPTTCANAPVDLNANGAVNYTWSPGTGLSATTGATVTATLSSNQTYTVIGTDANGCSSSAQSTVTIASNLAISVTLSAPTICAGESVTLNASGATSYTWTPSSTLNSGTGTTVIATPAVTTTYTINGSNAAGCTGTQTVTVTVNTPTPPSFSAYPAYCSGSTVPALPATSTNGVSGTWSPAINNSATTTYTFTPNTGQCATPATLTISINQPTPAQFNPLTPICQGQTAPVLPLTDLNGITGTWSPATVDNQVSSVYTFTPDANQCASQGTAISTIVANPVASFHPSATTMDITFTDVHFFNNSTNADTYSWTFGDGTGSTVLNPNHIYDPEAGSYTITLVATNQFGCTDQTQVTIEIKEDLIIFVPNAFTPDGDENNNMFFPVISGDFDPENYTMMIFDRWGEVIFETHDISIGWDGTYHDEYSQEGTYTWTINLKLKSNDAKKYYNGHVSILR